jgi:hypothetical protein
MKAKVSIMNTLVRYGRKRRWTAVAAALVLALAGTSLATADPGNDRGNTGRGRVERGSGAGNADRGGGRGQYRGAERRDAPAPVRSAERGYAFDSRFHHDRYYPPRGYTVARLEGGYRVVPYANGRYYYRAGAWYRPYGARFIVVAPPIGLVIPFLPDFYTTVWFGGLPYYYSNDTYYVWRREAQGYVVVDPPGNSPPPSTMTSSSADDFFMYPRNGQSEDLQARDRFECHRWAVSQTGFDPTEPGGGVPESQNDNRRADYRRAITACLEGRGYSVK